MRIQITLAVHANGNHVSLHKAHKNALVQIPMNPSPPALCDAKFIQESKLVQSFVLSQRGETGLYLSVSRFLSHTHRRDLIRSFAYVQTFTNTIYKTYPASFCRCCFLSRPLCLLFLYKRPLKAGFGRSPSGVKRQKVSPEMEEVDKAREKWRINRNHLKGNEESVEKLNTNTVFKTSLFQQLIFKGKSGHIL